jgi:hypothetical protein
MAKLVYVGRNDGNKGGLSSKAYTIRRQGRKVLARYGSVESVGGGGGQLSWFGSGPREETWTFLSVAKAAAFVKAKIAEKKSGGYDRLPGRVKIQPPRE